MGFISSLFETRARTSGLRNPATWLYEALGAEKSASGVRVTPENALESTTVWAAVRMISSTMAALPLHTYKRTDAGKEKAREHPNYRLLSLRPNPEMSSFLWRELMLAHLLLHGDHFSEIERDGRGNVVALWPLYPSQVRIERVNGERVFVVTVDEEEVAILAENMLHIRGFSLDGQRGLIPTQLARDAIGLTKATEKFGATFFRNGAAPRGVIEHPGQLGPEGQENLKKSLQRDHGSLSEKHRTLILEEGMKYSQLGIAPEHAQFLETRKFQVQEVARMFNIPPHLIGDLERATFSNVESQQIQYVQHCIMPWARRIEQELNHALFTDDSHFAEFQLQGLMRGDSAARAEYYRTLYSIGALSPNEIRAMENLNAYEGGDEYRVPLNMEHPAAEVETDAV